MPTITFDDPAVGFDDPAVLFDAGFTAPVPIPTDLAPPVPKRVSDLEIPTVSWTIDGLPVETTDASWSASEGGYDTASMRIKEQDARRVGQGSVLKGWSGVQCVFEGTLATNPAVNRGSASIQAQGYQHEAEKRSGTLLYQARGRYDQDWQDTADPPFEFMVSERIDAEAKPSALRWVVSKDESFSVAQQHGLALWAEGSPGGITRVAGTLVADGANNNFDWRLYRFTGPTGAQTLKATFINTSGSFDETFVTTEDAMVIAFGPFQGFPFSPNSKQIARIHNLRVNGILPGDNHKTYEVVQDMGTRLGWDISGVTQDTLNAMPYWLRDGTWRDGLDYMAMLRDWYWRVLDDRGSGPYLEYAPWGTRKWRVQLARGARQELTPEPIYRYVTVHFERENGAHRQRTVENTAVDPKIQDVWTEELSDPQTSGDLAQAVADFLLPRVSSPSHSGRLVVAGARSDDGLTDIHQMLPGDEIVVEDWGPADAVTLPISDVEWKAGEPATVGIELEATFTRVVALSELRGLRKRRKRGKRRRRGR